MKRSKSQYENDVATMLVGKRLTAVRYFEVRYDTDRPLYRSEPFPGHLLDYGCDLEMDDGSIFGIVWDSEYFQYGVGVFALSLSSRLTDVRVWDVTNDNHWASLIGRTIAKVKVYWSWAQYEGHERQGYPQDVELEFQDGAVVFLSASQYNKDSDTLWGMSDDIAVVFGRDSAKRYAIGPYAQAVAKKRRVLAQRYVAQEIPAGGGTMNVHFDDLAKQEVWQTLRALNDAWTKGDPNDLKNYFHKNMVAISATERERLEGREACFNSWNNFAKAVRIHHWKELEPRIQLYADTAVVTYYFDMSFDMGGQTVNLGGRDMFVFVREGGKWWAVADQFSPYPAT